MSDNQIASLPHREAAKLLRQAGYSVSYTTLGKRVYIVAKRDGKRAEIIITAGTVWAQRIERMIKPLPA